jgi:hypothetical protein
MIGWLHNKGVDMPKTKPAKPAKQSMTSGMDGMKVSESLKSVCQLAEDYMNTEQERHFAGWTSDEIAEAEASIQMVKKFIAILTEAIQNLRSQSYGQA